MADAERSGRRRPRAYDDEDTSPTTDRELKGWYSYGLAAEVYAVCGVGSFLPVTLEQLARERGVLRSDGSSCITPKTTTSDASRAFRWLVRRAADEQDESQCIVRPFGRDVSTASFAMYTFSIAVLVQALALISFSSTADHGESRSSKSNGPEYSSLSTGTYRKRFLLAFGFTGAVSSMLFILVSPSVYLLGSLLVIIGVACLGSSFVLLNSFLPLLARNEPSVTASADGNGFMNHEQPSEKTMSPELALSTKISAKGVGIGYTAAVFVQVLSIGLLVALNKFSFSSATIPLRAVLFVVGLWWAAFTVPCFLWLRDRPGPPLQSSHGRKSRLSQLLTYVVFAWSSVWRTVMVAVKMRQTLIFLIAWFLLSDAIATVSGTAILFARTELHMGTVPIAILSITATTSGIAGAFLWPIISRRLGLEPRRTILACIMLMEIIPIYGLIGYLPFIKAWGVGGLQQFWEIYPLGVVHGFVMGGLSSYCRSFYGLLIPPGSEAAFYALYAITDKGSSAVGPALVGLIVDATGTIRPAFGFLAVLILLPLPLIWMIDTEKGTADALSVARALAKGSLGDYEAVAMTEYDDEHGEGLLSGEN